MAEEWTVQIFPEMFVRLLEVLKAPADNTDMLWILIPIVLSMVIILSYSSRYRREGVDYLTALSNSVFLIFVSANLLFYLVTHQIFGADIRTSIVFFVVVIGVSLIIIDFFHLLPAKTIYRFSSKALFYFVAYVAVILTYTDMLVTTDHTFAYNIVTTLIALGLFYVLFQMIIVTIRLYVPPAQDATEALMSKTESELQEIAHKGLAMRSGYGDSQQNSSREDNNEIMEEEGEVLKHEPLLDKGESNTIPDHAQEGKHKDKKYSEIEDDYVKEENDKVHRRASSGGIKVFKEESDKAGVSNFEETQSSEFPEDITLDEPQSIIEGPVHDSDHNPLLTAQFTRVGVAGKEEPKEHLKKVERKREVIPEPEIVTPEQKPEHVQEKKEKSAAKRVLTDDF